MRRASEEREENSLTGFIRYDSSSTCVCVCVYRVDRRVAKRKWNPTPNFHFDVVASRTFKNNAICFLEWCLVASTLKNSDSCLNIVHHGMLIFSAYKSLSSNNFLLRKIPISLSFYYDYDIMHPGKGTEEPE